jgi:hypothetical protein
MPDFVGIPQGLGRGQALRGCRAMRAMPGGRRISQMFPLSLTLPRGRARGPVEVPNGDSR